MDTKAAVMAILPELEELEDVDFGQYAPPYPRLLEEFIRSGERGLPAFQRFAEKNVGKEAVGRVLLSVLQYFIIRYRRFGDYNVVKPAIKVFLTLKGWLNENGFEKDWERVLGSFVGYLVDMLPSIIEREDKNTALAYLTLIEGFAREAAEKFDNEYYDELKLQVEKLRETLG